MDTPVVVQKVGDVVVRETPLHEGKPHGVEKEYTPTGALFCERSWKHGVRDGAETYYKSDGAIAFTMTYKDGMLVGQN